MSSPFRDVVDDLTGGDGCACHIGTGYNTSCAHCRPTPESGAGPDEPRTEAGRRLVDALYGLGVDNDQGEAAHDVAAVEAEARAEAGADLRRAVEGRIAHWRDLIRVQPGAHAGLAAVIAVIDEALSEKGAE